MSKAHLEGFYYKPRVDRELLENTVRGSSSFRLSLRGGASAAVQGRIDEAKEAAVWHNRTFDGYYLELQAHEHIPHLDVLNQALISLSEELGIPLILTNDSHYTLREDAPIPGPADPAYTPTLTSTMKSACEWRTTRSTYALRRRWQRCSLTIPKLIPTQGSSPSSATLKWTFRRSTCRSIRPPDGLPAEEYLVKLCWEGLEGRVPRADQEYEERLRYELDVIKKTQFSNYFLVVWDIARFAHENGILLGVRGSAAASLVLYVTGVTDIDPLAYRLVNSSDSSTWNARKCRT